MRYSGSKLFILTMLGACLFLLAGCANIGIGTTINEDGSVHTKIGMTIDQSLQAFVGDNGNLLADQMKDWKAQGYTVKEVPGGFEAEASYPSIVELVQGGSNAYNPDESYGGVRFRTGLLYDTYSFDLIMTPKGQAMDTSNEMARSFLASAKADYTLNVPYPVDSANATKVSADKKSLVWDLKPAIFGDKNVSIQTQFRIYHKTTITILSILGVIVIIGGIVMVVLGVMKKTQDSKPLMIIGGAAIGIVVICGIIGIYQYKNPPTLTNEDRIIAENTKDSFGNDLKTTVDKLEKTTKNPIEEAQDILNEHGKKDGVSFGKVLAVSEIDGDGFTALVDDTSKGRRIFAVYNKAMDKVATVQPWSPRGTGADIMSCFFVNGYPDKDHPERTVYYGNDVPYFLITVYNDPATSENNNFGVREGNTLQIPVMASYYTENGKVVVESYATAGSLNTHTHFHNKMRQPYQQLADTFLTHFPSLQIDVRKQGVQPLEN